MLTHVLVKTIDSYGNDLRWRFCVIKTLKKCTETCWIV